MRIAKRRNGKTIYLNFHQGNYSITLTNNLYRRERNNFKIIIVLFLEQYKYRISNKCSNSLTLTNLSKKNRNLFKKISSNNNKRSLKRNKNKWKRFFRRLLIVLKKKWYKVMNLTMTFKIRLGGNSILSFKNWN